MDYSQFILQVRDSIFRKGTKDGTKSKLEKDILLCANGLTQQFVCDLYIAIESNNLFWVNFHQKEINAELYCDLMEAMHRYEFSLACIDMRPCIDTLCYLIPMSVAHTSTTATFKMKWHAVENSVSLICSSHSLAIPIGQK